MQDDIKFNFFDSEEDFNIDLDIYNDKLDKVNEVESSITPKQEIVFDLTLDEEPQRKIEFEPTPELELPKETKTVEEPSEPSLDTVDDIMEFILNQEETIEDILDEASNFEKYSIDSPSKSKKQDEESYLDYFESNGGSSAQITSFGMPTETNPLVVNKTGKNKYLVAFDLHWWYKNLTARIDYEGECLEVARKMMSIIEEDSSINNVILPGDIFHQGFPDLDSSSKWKDFFFKLKDVLNKRNGEIYAVIGNHEYTYSKNNLFWHLVDICIKTPEEIYDNGVKICLDSYHSKKSCRDFKRKVEGDICITHTEIVPPEVQKIMEHQGKDIFVTKHNGGFMRFDVKLLLVAHTHLLEGNYKVVNDETGKSMDVDYVGSSGRTNIKEISNDFLERQFRIINIDSPGEFSLSYIPILLRSVEDTLVQAEVKANKQAYEKRKILKEAKLTVLTDKPTEHVIREMNNNEVVVEMIRSAENGTYSKLVGSALYELQSVLK